ncbi:DNA alkylation repair protein [Flavobacterium kingsejongi]|uniref:DNA alkylation repair protein n=1 Tax=Flavobacterium kingsejongi TaxID=1678728 RepID=A0A2S1LQ91_9FLAO|nr:DNA alkylation repair protein [Flavobacterium kingsejongi]AWG25889.1 DNA alkylation repair protein [Flavobacterium kingsejongi]
MIPIKRKGSKSTKDIPAAIMAQLNCGTIATANLVEWLAVDQEILLEHLLIQLKREPYLVPILESIKQLKKQTVNTINEAIGTTLWSQMEQHNDTVIFETIATHPSDLVRCWAAYGIGHNPKLNIGEKLRQILPFAADPHFGVREISWLALRPSITAQLTESIALLATWTAHTDTNIRRFACEAIRPRGVWSAHIEALKKNPELALPIITPLQSDPSKYVQDSVGNWLNDASKSNPNFVWDLCQKWKTESDTKATAYIVKKALRTLQK